MTFQKGNQLRLKPLPKKLIENKLLAYILGVIVGDGHLTKYTILLGGVIDKDFVLAFKKILEDWTGLKVSFHIYGKDYWVELCSKSVVSFLKNYNNINKIADVVKRVNGEKEFLRGIYDSEGCVGNKEIIICNKNKQLLLLCKKLLLSLGIGSGKIYIGVKKGTLYKFSDEDKGTTNYNNYKFEINGKYNLIKFRNLIGFNIKRKQKKLISEINSYLSKKQTKFMKSLPNDKRKNWREGYNNKNNT